MDVLVVAIARDRYAIVVSRIREIVRVAAWAQLPGAPALIEGVVNVRGKLIPVLGLRRRFSYPSRPIELSDFLVIAAAGSRDVALHVDHVIGVDRVPEGDVIPATELVRRSEFIGGLAALGDGTLLIQDPSAFLAESESEALDAALAREAGL
jgi:purine-binding chemotaxis protein CheW